MAGADLAVENQKFVDASIKFESYDPSVRLEALKEISLMGETGARMVPRLLLSLTDLGQNQRSWIEPNPNVRAAIKNTIKDFGGMAVPYLIDASIDWEHFWTGQTATTLLTEIATTLPLDKQQYIATELMQRSIEKDYKNVNNVFGLVYGRVIPGDCVGGIGPAAAVILPQLEEIVRKINIGEDSNTIKVNDKNVGIHINALCWVFEQIGAQAVRSIPVLESHLLRLGNENDYYYKDFQRAIEKIRRAEVMETSRNLRNNKDANIMPINRNAGISGAGKKVLIMR